MARSRNGRVAWAFSWLIAAILLVPAPRQALAYGYTVVAQSWSPWIQESGKSTGGMSEYICPDNQAMIGRKHQGDENGNTSYLCGKVYYNGAEVPISTGASSYTYARWSADMKESNSYYTCPVNKVMTGRRHSGDENGNTSYLCTPIIYGGNFVVLDWDDAWSAPIQESGKSTGGESSFTCPTNKVMVGRQHEGDENGNTRYLCATIVPSQSPAILGQGQQYGPFQESGKKTGGESRFTCPDNWIMNFRSHSGDENGNTYYGCIPGKVQKVNFTTTVATWGPWIQESGKNSGGQSSYTCPSPQIMVGRAHKGDENGNTQYACSYMLVQGEVGAWGEIIWSDWMKESSSYYTCPLDQVMIGRQHQGDENGNTRYQCASVTMPFMPTTLSQAVDETVLQVGVPATRTSTSFATRDSMQIGSDYFLNLDVGGEGNHTVGGISSGFVGAVNINAQENDSQPPYGPIPLLILLDPWGTSPPYPFADGTANYITMQGAPLTNYYVGEMARVIAPKGQIGLWIDNNAYRSQIQTLADALNSTPVLSTAPGSSCFDEFPGMAGHPKTCIANNRP
jgi:hypothetical protein